MATGEIKVNQAAAREYRRQPCFVYIVHEVEQDSVCKVGVALNAARRFSHLQVGTWRQLKLASAFLLPSEEAAHVVEALVHSELQAKRKRGEWFAVTQEVAAAAVRSAAENAGYSILEPQPGR